MAATLSQLQAMKPLTQGHPAVLKPYLIAKRDKIKDSCGDKHRISSRWIHPSGSLEGITSPACPHRGFRFFPLQEQYQGRY